MSITYKIFLISILIAFSFPAQAQEQVERHYRVEIIVFRHLDGTSDTAPEETLRDLTDVLDLDAPPATEEELAEEAKRVAALMPTNPSNDNVSGVLELDPETGLPIEEIPPAIKVEEMGETMREAWRRMRLSAGFRPELFRAWEQSGNEPFPELRIHDDELLLEVKPVADVPVDEFGALVFSDATMDARGDIDTGLDSDQELMADELPPTQRYYRIDGTATLTRTRFLHMDLDIELREPLYETMDLDNPAEPQQTSPELKNSLGTQTEAPAAAAILTETTGPATDASAFRVHRIKQKRQVKTEQMEYFDGPVIGLLVWITGFDVPLDPSTSE